VQKKEKKQKIIMSLRVMQTALSLRQARLLASGRVKTDTGARIDIAKRDVAAWPSDCLHIDTGHWGRTHPFPQDSRITFVEATHKYYIDGNTEPVKTSVTSFVHAPFPSFNAQEKVKTMSTKTRTSAKYAGLTNEEILAQWDAHRDACARVGTKMHAAVEIYLNTGVLSTDPEIQPEMAQLMSFMEREITARGIKTYRTEPTIFAEPSSGISLAGSVDYLGRDEEGKFWIMDWKRSSKITKSANGNFGYGNDLCNGEENVNYIHYSLQLHTYRYLFARFYNVHVDPNHLYIVVFHKDHHGYEMYPAKNLSHLVDQMFARFDYWADLAVHNTTTIEQ
jgi:ATP-dependent exoDNAse (exonuclease V) beta subunit